MARPARDPGIDGPRDTVSATPPPTPGFLAIPIDSGAPFRRLVNQLGPRRLTLFLKLNRVDLAHVRAGDTLLLPADSTAGELALAPFPTRLPALDSVPKLLAVSLRVQAFAAYDSGRLVIGDRPAPESAPRRAPRDFSTPTGRPGRRAALTTRSGCCVGT